MPINVVDLGCGNGNSTQPFVDKYLGARFLLVDDSTKMLEACDTRFVAFQTTGKKCLIQDLEMASGSVDLVIASFSIHHLKKLEKKILFGRIFNWLRSGGILTYADLFVDKEAKDHHLLVEQWQQFVTKNAGSDAWQKLYLHYNRFDCPSPLAEQIRWLKEAGFTVIRPSIFQKFWGHIFVQK